MSKLESKRVGIDHAQAKTLIVEWEFTEDDRAWHLAETASPAASISTHRWGRRWWVMSAGTLLFLLAAEVLLWYQANAGLHQIERELRAAVEADAWRVEQNSQIGTTHKGVLQDIVEAEYLPEFAHIQIIDLGKDWAIVQVTWTQGAFSYRQTRLYRSGVNGWYVAPLSAALWGAPRTLETPFFVFHYYALDTEAVAVAAAKLDAIYPDLLGTYTPESASDPKRQIWVNPEYSLTGLIGRNADAALMIPSPAIYSAPTELSEGDILAQAILLGLLDTLTEQTLAHHLPTGPHELQASARVAMLLESLRLWHLWSTTMPLAHLHKPTIQWLYSDMQEKRMLPAFDAKLCPLHQLWGAAPLSIQIPLFCGDVQQTERYEVGRYLPLAPPRSLAETHLYRTVTPDEPYAGLGEAEPVKLVTLVDYVVATYGRQSLSTLVTNTASHTTWETLIPATFGVSYSDFETGWQAHLHNHYGVAASVIP